MFINKQKYLNYQLTLSAHKISAHKCDLILRADYLCADCLEIYVYIKVESKCNEFR